MGVADLPSSIAAGACVLQPGCGFPLGLPEASAKGRAEEAYPVLVLGTQVNNFSACAGYLHTLRMPSVEKLLSDLSLTDICIS